VGEASGSTKDCGISVPRARRIAALSPNCRSFFARCSTDRFVAVEDSDYEYEDQKVNIPSPPRTRAIQQLRIKIPVAEMRRFGDWITDAALSGVAAHSGAIISAPHHAHLDYLEKSPSICRTFGSPCHADHRAPNDAFADVNGARIASSVPSKVITCGIDGGSVWRT
jgi:hypothetical protein